MPIVKDLYDLLAEYVRIGDKRIIKPFDEIVTPIHDQFVQVHAQYRDLFLETIYGLRGLEYPWLSEEQDERFEKIKSQFIRGREEREDLRDKLRAEAQGLLTKSSHAATNRYIASVIHYFLEQKATKPTDSELDDIINRAIEKGGITYYETPSVRVELELRNTASPTRALSIVEQTLNQLNDRFAEVCSRYIQVKFEMTQLP